MLGLQFVLSCTQSGHLNDVQAGGSGSAHVDGDGFDQSAFGKVLDLFGHGGAKEQCLSLTLNQNTTNKQKQLLTMY